MKPGVQFAVFYFVMGMFLGFRDNLDPYAIFLFSGVVLINLFSEVMGNTTRAVVWNAPLVKKIYMPRQLFPVSSVLVALVHFAPQLLILLIGAIASGWTPDLVGIAAALLAILIVLAFALGLGLLFGAINVAYRDIENIVDLILMVAVWFSPVLYSISMVYDYFGEGSWLTALYEANPLTVAVELFHRAFWLPAAGEGMSAMVMNDVMVHGVAVFGVSLALLAIGDRIFTRMSRTFAQEL